MLEPSEVFGEAFVCAGIKSIPVDVVALGETVVMLLSLPDIPLKNTDIYNCFILNLLRTSSVKNLVLMKRLEVTSKRSTEEKLMTYLMQTAKEQGKSSFHITYDRQQLADYLEVDRSGLSAVIGKLKKKRKNQNAVGTEDEQSAKLRYGNRIKRAYLSLTLHKKGRRQQTAAFLISGVI